VFGFGSVAAFGVVETDMGAMGLIPLSPALSPFFSTDIGMDMNKEEVLLFSSSCASRFFCFRRLDDEAFLLLPELLLLFLLRLT
jgi:hypothetical protein